MATSAVIISFEMFELIAPVLYLSRIFGLQPIKWTKSERNYILRKSVNYIVYSGIVVTICVSASIYGLSQVYKLDVVYSIRIGNNTSRYVTYSDVGVVLMPCVLGFVSIAVNVEKYLNFFDCLSKCDFHLKKPLQKSGKCMFVTVVTMFFTWSILVFDMVMWITLSSYAESVFFLLLYFLPYYICYSFTMILELLYWLSVHLVKVRIVHLNQELCEAVSHDKDLFLRIDRKKINNVVDNLKSGKIKQIQKNKNTTTFGQVQDLITAYQKLVDATDFINECFGLTLLIIILGCLIHLLVTPYALYSIISNTGRSLFIVSQSIWMIGHVLRLFLIVEPCHGCLVQSRNTLAAVCKLRLLCTESDAEIRTSLEFFLTYLSQCRIEFTAFGLTRIHRGLLSTIAGAVTTYLVILFQFNRA